MQATLVLEDGSRFVGEAFGAAGTTVGEVVFQTGMTGYQEVITDPSYCQQLVLMTYPLIGNYGINREDFEAPRPACRALIVKEWAQFPNHWQMDLNLDQYLREMGVLGLSGIDTRSLTRKLRSKGTMKGLLASGPDASAAVEQAAKLLQPPLPRDLVSRMSAKEVQTCWPGSDEHALERFSGNLHERASEKLQKIQWKRVESSQGEPAEAPNSSRLHVVLIDYGAKENMAREMLKRGCRITRVPFDTKAEMVEALAPDGIVLSNGPGDPKDLPETLPVIRRLMRGYPLFGICLGHQLFALACGARTEKMKFGHRGANQPVAEVGSGKAWMTSQNHGYTVLDKSLEESSLEVTHRALNDDTIEGLRHLQYPAFSVQFHPEAAPGPTDTTFLFDQFIQLMQQKKGVFAHA